MKAKELDKKFNDNSEDILNHFEPIEKSKRVNIDFPPDVLNDLDQIAKTIGVTRQSLLKMWIYTNVQIEKKKMAS